MSAAVRARGAETGPGPAGIRVRPAGADDAAAVIAIDAASTGLAKPGYWRDVFSRCLGAARDDHHLLVAADGERVIGFIVGEVRAWEFGSPPCGWVFAIDVAPEYRERAVGTALFAAICARFKAAGITIVRTMLSRRDTLNLSFFRAQGMTAGPYVQLEMTLDRER